MTTTDTDLAAEYERLTERLADNVRGLLAEDSGDGDEWGWCLCHHFGIAEALLWHGEDIPGEWQFNAPMGPQPCEDYPACDWAAALELGTMTGDDLRAAGDALSAYAELLRGAGLDY